MKKIALFLTPVFVLSLLTNCGNNNKEYTITFDTNNGTPEVSSQIVKGGDYAEDPKIDVKRNNQSLKFWSLQDEYDPNPTEFSFSTTKITSDITLHAIYPSSFSGPLAIKCTKGPATLKFYWMGIGDIGSTDVNVKWSKDKINWNEMNAVLTKSSDEIPTLIPNFVIDLTENETVYLAGDNPRGFSFYNQKCGRAVIITDSDGSSQTQDELEVSGNPLSLVSSTDYKSITKVPDSCFYELFGSSNITSAKGLDLPCNILSASCYSEMFSGCKKLISAPNLPSLNLANSCYSKMFSGCTNLVEAPELPAYEFGENCKDCYKMMFNGCKKISKVRVGFGKDNKWPWTPIESNYGWLLDTAEKGTLEWKGSDSPSIEHGNYTIPEGWEFVSY